MTTPGSVCRRGLMPRERTQAVCDGLAAAMRAHGVPEQILTDNGKVFTGRFHHPPVEVLFDRICRENGVEHLLTAPRSPTTTGKVERFHRTLRLEFDTTPGVRVAGAGAGRPGRVGGLLQHRAPASVPGRRRPPRTGSTATRSPRPRAVADRPEREPRRRPGVGRAQGRPRTGSSASARSRSASASTSPARHCDVLVTDGLLQFWIGDQLVKTATRTDPRPIRKKRAAGTSPRRRIEERSVKDQPT